MYIDYSKLWKLLIDKGITKTELSQITGISSRVVAKLSKNETVTTDTIARICTVLECDVSDIMECKNEEKLSVYKSFVKFGECTEENELYKTVRFTHNGQKYTVFSTKRSANKATHIHCEDNGTVYWEQLYPFGGISYPSREKFVLIKPTREKGEITIVLIKGRPALITGLDEGTFVSSRAGIKRASDIFVMSETAFKLF